MKAFLKTLCISTLVFQGGGVFAQTSSSSSGGSGSSSCPQDTSQLSCPSSGGSGGSSGSSSGGSSSGGSGSSSDDWVKEFSCPQAAPAGPVGAALMGSSICQALKKDIKDYDSTIVHGSNENTENLDGAALLEAVGSSGSSGSSGQSSGGSGSSGSSSSGGEPSADEPKAKVDYKLGLLYVQQGTAAISSASTQQDATSQSSAQNNGQAGQSSGALYMKAAQSFQSCVKDAKDALCKVGNYQTQIDQDLQTDISSCGQDGDCKKVCTAFHDNFKTTLGQCKDGGFQGPGMTAIQQSCQTQQDNALQKSCADSQSVSNNAAAQAASPSPSASPISSVSPSASPIAAASTVLGTTSASLAASATPDATLSSGTSTGGTSGGTSGGTGAASGSAVATPDTSARGLTDALGDPTADGTNGVDGLLTSGGGSGGTDASGGVAYDLVGGSSSDGAAANGKPTEQVGALNFYFKNKQKGATGQDAIGDRHYVMDGMTVVRQVVSAKTKTMSLRPLTLFERSSSAESGPDGSRALFLAQGEAKRSSVKGPMPASQPSAQTGIVPVSAPVTK